MWLCGWEAPRPFVKLTKQDKWCWCWCCARHHAVSGHQWSSLLRSVLGAVAAWFWLELGFLGTAGHRLKSNYKGKRWWQSLSKEEVNQQDLRRQGRGTSEEVCNLTFELLLGFLVWHGLHLLLGQHHSTASVCEIICSGLGCIGNSLNHLVAAPFMGVKLVCENCLTRKAGWEQPYK